MSGQALVGACPHDRRRGWSHGTATGYKNHACRCAPCTRAWRDYSRAYVRPRAARAAGAALLRQPPPTPAPPPVEPAWWTLPDVPREGLTALVVREHQHRMSQSAAGRRSMLVDVDTWQ